MTEIPECLFSGETPQELAYNIATDTKVKAQYEKFSNSAKLEARIKASAESDFKPPLTVKSKDEVQEQVASAVQRQKQKLGV